jgi:hypothetical protein
MGNEFLNLFSFLWLLAKILRFSQIAKHACDPITFSGPDMNNFEYFQQCCGSGSALIWLFWIHIRIGNADRGSRSMETDQN